MLAYLLCVNDNAITSYLSVQLLIWSVLSLINEYDLDNWTSDYNKTEMNTQHGV